MILLDTCAIVWDALDPGKLSGVTRQTINDADRHGKLLVADISLWEIAMLVKRSRLEIAAKSSHFINLYLESRNVSVIPISAEIAELSCSFPPDMNNDPADRLIAATSIVHHARLVTADTNLQQSRLLDVIW